MLGREGRPDAPAGTGTGTGLGKRKVKAPGRSLQVSLVRSPGARRLPRTPCFPRPPHPCAQPLQKQLLQALATPPRWPRMLLPQMAGPRRAGLPLCLLKLLLAAMTAPRAAGRGVRVRVRERAGWWDGRASGRAPRRRRLSRGTCGRARGTAGEWRSRARALAGGATRAGARLGSALLR